MSNLPVHYDRWITGLLAEPLPSEGRATCGDCPMCKPEVVLDARPFMPDTKCCTYTPALPSFQVGAILTDPDVAEGAARVRERIAQGIGLTPLGLFPSPAYTDRYTAECIGGEPEFGRLRDMRCPYYIERETGLCGIWKHRNGMCATWFCKYERGRFGLKFWTEMLRFITHLEEELARHAALALGLDDEALATLFDPIGRPRSFQRRELRGFVADDGRAEVALQKRMWGAWYEREAEFFIAAHEHVSKLSIAEIRQIGGVGLEIGLRKLKMAQRDNASTAIPERLAFVPEQPRQVEGGQAVIARGPSIGNDPIVLPTPVYYSLVAFDGSERAVGEARAAQWSGHVMAPELIGKLYDLGILSEPTGPDLPPVALDRTPVQPDDRLRFFRGYTDQEVGIMRWGDEAGQQFLQLGCGQRTVTFDRPEILELGRQLVVRQNGFVAGDAVGWTMPGMPLTWPDVAEVLDAMLEAGVLQKVPRE